MARNKEFFKNTAITTLKFQATADIHTWVRVNRSALKQDSGSPVGQWAVHTVTVSCYPANVSHTAKHILIMVAEDALVIKGT